MTPARLAPSATLPDFIATLDGKRIAATAGAIAVHVGVLMLLMVPAQIAPPAAVDDTPITVEFKKKPPPPIVIPRPEDKPRPVTKVPQVLPKPEPVAVEVINDTPSPVDPWVEEVTLDPPALEAVAEVADTGFAQIQALVAPAPAYPSDLLRRRIGGLVLLKVLVGADGRATQVGIETSSGHRQLDEAARKTVLKRWRFEPSTQGGRPVSAWALVPISFEIRS